MDDLPTTGGGDMARSDDVWSRSGRGESEKVGDAKVAATDDGPD